MTEIIHKFQLTQGGFTQLVRQGSQHLLAAGKIALQVIGNPARAMSLSVRTGAV